MMKKKICAVILSIVMITALLAGCGGTSAPGNASTQPSGNTQPSGGTQSAAPVKDTLVYGTSGEPTTLDPQNAVSGNDLNAINNIYDTLVDVDDQGNVTPRLAETWDKSTDSLTYTLHLKQGVKWQNGEIFTANDVKYTFDKAMTSPYCMAYLTSLISTAVVDHNTVKMTLNAPDQFFLQNLGLGNLAIINEKAVTAGGEDYGRNPIGTGAYKFVSWSSGDKIILERFDDCWRGKAAIKTVTTRIIPDASSRTIALQNGEVDLIDNIAANDIDTLKNDTKVAFYQVVTPIVFYVGMNEKVAPFDNPLVRQAISYAIDKNAILLGAANGNGVIANSLLPDSIVGAADISYPFDVTKAKELLAQAGYPNGFETTLAIMGFATGMAPIIQSQLADIGVTVKIDSMDPNAFIQNNAANAIFVLSGAGITPNPDSMLYSFAHSSYAGPAGNMCYINDAQIDALLDQAKAEQDSAKRLDLYTQIQSMLKDNAAAVPLYFRNSNTATAKNLIGYVASPFTIFSFYNLSW